MLARWMKGVERKTLVVPIREQIDQLAFFQEIADAPADDLSDASTCDTLCQHRLRIGDPKTNVTGKYFYHLKRMDPNPQANNPALQDRLIGICADISNVVLPGVSMAA